MFSAEPGTIPLIAKLFQGWLEVRSRPGTPAEIHLTTNASASEDSRNSLISPVDFESALLRPARSPQWKCPEEHKETYQELLRVTKAPDESTFLEFLRALRLEVNAPDEDELRERVVALLRRQLRPRAQAETESKAWLERVYDLATQTPAPEPLTPNDIDRELRELFHLPPKAEHHLALPLHHVPRSRLAAAILEKARAIASGYVLVLGPPGCGKTTLATWLANVHPEEVLLRYHVFDPMKASGIEVGARASALEFVGNLFDVLKQRFPDTAEFFAPTAETLGEAVDKLRADLSRVAHGTCRLVIVDGIDHVVRSRVTHQSLFDAIPNPAPENVVLVLFGQPGWEYPAWLLRSAQRIDVPPFDELESRTHVFAQMAWTDTEAARAVASQLHTRSEGNPLSLFYNLTTAEALGTTPEAVSEGLPGAKLFAGNPHQEYARLLDDLRKVLPAVKGSASLTDELATCVAVATFALTESRLQAAFVNANLTLHDARDLLAGLRPVVVDRGAGRYWLFHDDFRRFVEESYEPQSLAEAHRRLARSLEQDWAGDELSAWAEHLWKGEAYARLADLPGERELAHWFLSSSEQTVVRMHNLALAAAFKQGDRLVIFRNALSAERAVETANLQWAPQDAEETPAPGLRGWSFVVPPQGLGCHALIRRAAALDAAGSAFQEDPSLAAEIAARFQLPKGQLGAVEERAQQDAGTYVAALARWYLRSDDLSEARRLCAELDSWRGYSLKACAEELAGQTDLAVLTSWAKALAGTDSWLDWKLAEAATLHLAEGRTAQAEIIARVLEGIEPRAPETARAAGTLLSVLDGRNRTLWEHEAAPVRFNDLVSEPVECCEFFFHGFTSAAAGEIKELRAWRFPSRFTAHPKDGQRGVPAHAELPWKLGCAAGLACRGEHLLRPEEVRDLLEDCFAQRTTGAYHLDNYSRGGLTAIYVPVLMHSIRRRGVLLEAARTTILPLVSEAMSKPEPRTYGLLESIWLLSPQDWREVASTALSVSVVPGSEGVERADWFDYWAKRAEARGVELSTSFRELFAVARLGVPRKTAPSYLATKLLPKAIASSEEGQVHIQRLLDLLIRLGGEPEGRRSAKRDLPSALTAALLISASLFRDEFLRCTCEHELAEAFGDTPASIAYEWLDQGTPVPIAELVSLWHWVAASPGGLDSDGSTEKAGLKIIERLRALGESAQAEDVQRWLGTLVAPQATGAGSGAGQQIATTERPAEPEAQGPSPSLDEVNWKWFSSYFGEREFPALRAYLEQEGDAAWRTICERMANEYATAPLYHGYDGVYIANGLVELEQVPAAEAFEVAMTHLAEKVCFQPAPSSRLAPGPSQDRAQVFVGLLARGLDVADIETVTRALRGLAALARNRATSEIVEAEMCTRLRGEEARAVVHALLVLRQLERMSQSTRAEVSDLSSHPNAWCRWVACQISGEKLDWSDRRALHPPAPPLEAEPQPAATELGSLFFSDPTSIRQIHLKKLSKVTGEAEEALGLELEIEARALPDRPERARGWRRGRGNALNTSHSNEAAGRLVARLASTVPPEFVPALLGAVAPQDPWLATAEPLVEPPQGWVELCRYESGQTGERKEFLLRSLGLVHRGNLFGPESVALKDLAEVAFSFLAPAAPTEFAWVSDRWGAMAAPVQSRGPVVPLSFRNSPFIELNRSKFMLVPSYGLPIFRELYFDGSSVPRWVTAKGEAVVTAARGETLSRAGNGQHAEVRWWNAWYALPTWLRSFLRPETALIRFWRLEWQEVRYGARKAESQVEFDAEECTLETEA